MEDTFKIELILGKEGIDNPLVLKIRDFIHDLMMHEKFLGEIYNQIDKDSFEAVVHHGRFTAFCDLYFALSHFKSGFYGEVKDE